MPWYCCVLRSVPPIFVYCRFAKFLLLFKNEAQFAILIWLIYKVFPWIRHFSFFPGQIDFCNWFLCAKEKWSHLIPIVFPLPFHQPCLFCPLNLCVHIGRSWAQWRISLRAQNRHVFLSLQLKLHLTIHQMLSDPTSHQYLFTQSKRMVG